MAGRIVDVVMLSGIPKALSYSVPEGMPVAVGLRVSAPVRVKDQVGVIIGVRPADPEDTGLKDISGILDEQPCITREIIDLIQWTSRYYHAGIGMCMALAFPPYYRQGRSFMEDEDPVLVKAPGARGKLTTRQQEILQAIPGHGIRRSALRALFPGGSERIRVLLSRGFIESRTSPEEGATRTHESLAYTADQTRAIGEITKAIDARSFHVFVLHGITGSGKTEVYLASAIRALGQGRSVLYLVPEIALTPQTIEMVRNRIPFEVAVFHSGLSFRDRAREFMRVVEGGVRFVLGTRSAIFSPLKDIGLVVVDEEHDHSYKQDDGVPYNARDLSILRARNNSAAVILGSATPSMETYVRAKQAHASLLSMTSRVGPAALPQVEVVDMRNIRDPLSESLLKEMENTLLKGEQVLLFINRRGYSAALVCPGCGKVLHCSRCDRSLTYHKSKGKALCHWCGFVMRLPEICPSCGCLDMKPLGLGTEKVLQAVEEAFPGRRMLRMDSDEITTTLKLAASLDAIRSGEVDIIVGTQMIAKGHDFPLLTLVGVVHAEQLLHMPDFRSGERTFQQIVQVAGRAGRRKSDTKVLIQSLIPDHPLMVSISRYDYDAMMREELAVRKATGFPPFMHMARCVVSSTVDRTARDYSLKLASSVTGMNVDVLGPAPAPISLLRNRYRWHTIVRSGNRGALHAAIDALEQVPCPGAVELRIDVDPYSMM